MREATTNGIKLVYREEGSEADPLLVLLHGRTADHNNWNGITQHFARRHHVLVPDLRGHGASDHPGSYALTDMADDIAALLAGRRAVVVGHSLGGVVAYVLAARHPELVERLVLEDPAPPLPLTGRAPIEEDDSTGFDWRMVHETEKQFISPDPALAGALGGITAPTLIVSGGPSSHVRSEPLAELIPGAELVTIDAGHLVHENARADFVAAVDRFLP
ncbi:alpha/beta fold hydrolase [Nonomuraea sediminis]|uniref:alpha/beta fold hydrolase n=1 Tax=Nonomuraea sediminis TaxID=2835864 RepID=UPI001BDCD5DF|nr:alpha/beta hydrolase [Nonomuraea sediminis]